MPFTVFVSQRMEGGAQGGREVSRSRFTKYLTPSREKQIRYWWGKKDSFEGSILAELLPM